MLGLHTPLTNTVINPVILPNTNTVPTPDSNQGYVASTTYKSTHANWLQIDQKPAIGRYHIFNFLVDIDLPNMSSSARHSIFVSTMKTAMGTQIDLELYALNGKLSMYAVAPNRPDGNLNICTVDLNLSGKTAGTFTHITIAVDRAPIAGAPTLFPEIFIDGLPYNVPAPFGSVANLYTDFMGSVDKVFAFNTTFCNLAALTCHNTDTIDINIYGSYDSNSKQWFCYKQDGIGWGGNSFAYDGRNFDLQDVITVAANELDHDPRETSWPKDSPYQLGVVFGIPSTMSSNASTTYMIPFSPLVAPSKLSGGLSPRTPMSPNVDFLDTNRNLRAQSVVGFSPYTSKLIGLYNAPNKGVHCIKYTGNGGTLTVPHLLNKRPTTMMFFAIDSQGEHIVWCDGIPSNVCNKLAGNSINSALPYDLWDNVTASNMNVQFQPDGVSRGTSKLLVAGGTIHYAAEVRAGKLVVYSHKPIVSTNSKDKRVMYDLTTAEITIPETLPIGNGHGAFLTHDGVDFSIDAAGVTNRDTGTATAYASYGAAYANASIIRAERIAALNIVVAVIKTASVVSQLVIFRSNGTGIEISTAYDLPSQLFDNSVGKYWWHISQFTLANGNTYITVPNHVSYKRDNGTQGSQDDKCFYSTTIYEITPTSITNTGKNLKVPGASHKYFSYNGIDYILGMTMAGNMTAKAPGMMYLATIKNDLSTEIIQVLNRGGGSHCVPYTMNGIFYLYISASGHWSEESNYARRYLFNGYIRDEEILPAGQGSFVYPIKIGTEERLFCISPDYDSLVQRTIDCWAFDLVFDDGTNRYMATETEFPFSVNLNKTGKDYLMVLLSEDMVDVIDIQANTRSLNPDGLNLKLHTIAPGLEVGMVHGSNKANFIVKDPLTGELLPYLDEVHSNLLIDFQNDMLIGLGRLSTLLLATAYDWTTGCMRTIANRVAGMQGFPIGFNFDGTNLSLYTMALSSGKIYKEYIPNIFVTDGAQSVLTEKLNPTAISGNPTAKVGSIEYVNGIWSWTIITPKHFLMTFDPIAETITSTLKSAAAGGVLTLKFRRNGMIYECYSTGGNGVIYSCPDTDPTNIQLEVSITKSAVVGVQGNYILTTPNDTSTFGSITRLTARVYDLDAKIVYTHANVMPTHTKNLIGAVGTIFYYDTEYLLSGVKHGSLFQVTISKHDKSVPDKVVLTALSPEFATRVGNVLTIRPRMAYDEPSRFINVFTLDLVTGEVSTNSPNINNRYSTFIGLPTFGAGLLTIHTRSISTTAFGSNQVGKHRNEDGVRINPILTSNQSFSNASPQLGSMLYPINGNYKVVAIRDKGIGFNLAKDKLNSKMVFDDTNTFYSKNDFVFPTAKMVGVFGGNVSIDTNCYSTAVTSKGQIINFPVLDNTYFELYFWNINNSRGSTATVLKEQKTIYISDLEIANNRYAISFKPTQTLVFELLTDTLLFTLPAVPSVGERIGVYFVNDKLIKIYSDGVYAFDITLPRSMSARSVLLASTNTNTAGFQAFFRRGDWKSILPTADEVGLAKVITNAKIVSERNKVFNAGALPKKGLVEHNTSTQYNTDLNFTPFTRQASSNIISFNNMFGTSWALINTIGTNSTLASVIVGNQPFRKANPAQSVQAFRHGIPTGKEHGVTKLEYNGEGLASKTFAHGLTQKPEMVMILLSTPAVNTGIIYLSDFDLGAGLKYKKIQLNSVNTLASKWIQIDDETVTITKEGALNLFEIGTTYFIMFAHSVPGTTYIGKSRYDHHTACNVMVGGIPLWGMLLNEFEATNVFGMSSCNHFDRGTCSPFKNDSIANSPHGVVSSHGAGEYLVAFGIQHWSNAFRLTDDFKSIL